MIDAITLLNAIFAATAVIYGLSSRNFTTALVAGLFTGLIYAGVVALVGAQSGKFELAELPYLKDAVDEAMKTGYLTFAHARYVTYLVLCAFVLLFGTIVAWLVRWGLCSLVRLATPAHESETTPT